MANALKDIERPKVYNPIVTLRQEGVKTPLFLVHPGLGEILVFLGLARHISDRPVYALRARGFDGEPYFSSIEETVSTYLHAMRERQPRGPYALAGYSFGTMLAFEIAKRLESDNEEVRFLGSFNLPPHIRWRMRQLDWPACLIHLCFFLDLMPESRAEALAPQIRSKYGTTTEATDSSKEAALSVVSSNADEQRMTDLSLNPSSLLNWVNLTYSMQSKAVDYEPSGSVGAMDIFYAVPLREAAGSKQEWLDVHLRRWADFVRTEPPFHEVDGAHYTMLSQEHVKTFAKTLAKAMEARGV